PPDTPQDDFPLKLTALEVDHAAAPPPRDSRSSIAEHLSSEKLRQIREAYFAFGPAGEAGEPQVSRSVASQAASDHGDIRSTLHEPNYQGWWQTPAAPVRAKGVAIAWPRA